MTRIEGTRLSPALLALLDGSDLEEKVGETFLLLTVSENGWPHLAMLSAGELVAVESESLRLALWPGTETGKNLKDSGRATIVAVADGAGHYIETDVTFLGDLGLPGGPLDLFTCTVRRVLVDTVDYATLTTGIRFELVDAQSVLARWGRTVGAMLQPGSDREPGSDGGR